MIDAIRQFFGVSERPCSLRNLQHTDLTLLKSIWNSLIDADSNFSSKLVMLVYIFIIETAINHTKFINELTELQKHLDQGELRKSCGGIMDISYLKLDSVNSFYPLTQEDIMTLYEWYGRQLLSPKMVHSDSNFVEFVPNLVLPSFNSFKVINDDQNALVKTFMAVVAKKMHHGRQFMTHNKVKNFMEYCDFFNDYLNRFKYLSINKKAESQFNFSCTFSEKFKADEINEIQDIPGPLHRRMKSMSEKPPCRPRFKSDTLIHGLQPIANSSKRLSTRNAAVHVQRESSKELVTEPQKCSYCQSQVNGLIWICSKCLHGGHLNHMNTWFKENSNCPKCFNCKCRD